MLGVDAPLHPRFCNMYHSFPARQGKYNLARLEIPDIVSITRDWRCEVSFPDFAALPNWVVQSATPHSNRVETRIPYTEIYVTGRLGTGSLFRTPAQGV